MRSKRVNGCTNSIRIVPKVKPEARTRDTRVFVVQPSGVCLQVFVAYETSSGVERRPMPDVKKKLTVFGRYLKKQNLSAADAAEQLDVTRSYINALATGAQTPGLKLALEILHWSDGAVPAESWIK